MGKDKAARPEPLPRLRLDDLLEELQVRINAVRGTRDRVHELLEAVLSVGQELELAQVLRGIVEAAVVLVDAEYGALGVIGDEERLAQFLTEGVSPEQISAIGPLPSGHGLLGELIRHPEPLRLAELSEHPSSVGFPANHPPMHSFLGVPIRIRQEVFGNLYLTQKRRAAEFDAEDEAVLSTLAVAAGVAIENARLYEETRRGARWIAANAEVISGLLSGMAEAQVLELILSRSREITGADLGAVALPVAGSDDLRVVLAIGLDAEQHQGLVLPRVGTFVGACLAAGAPVVSADIDHDPRVSVGPPRWQGLGPAVSVPLGAGERIRGVLLLARASGEPAFTSAEADPLSGFAAQAAVALELAERRRDAEQMSLLEDRDRIARDLHDVAIQRLFATGMTLQSALRFVSHPEATDRLTRAVDDLDDTIKIIRSTIFGLRAHAGPGRGLRVLTARTVAEAAPLLGFTPSVRTDGLVDTAVPRSVADDVIAVLGEALSNIVRHAKATSTEVAVGVADGTLTLTVTDNGVGLGTDGRRSGLRNLAERAEKLGGRMELASPDGGGTRLLWRVPLSG
ncbi:GAF domain-containing protein [Streptomyces sp. NPDC006733]|uniref:sensor histidine kinase n=1 Tax=Streptomyces sp. NPDC006733 TaxID=3155460 RepID=UPI0033F00692